MFNLSFYLYLFQEGEEIIVLTWPSQPVALVTRLRPMYLLTNFIFRLRPMYQVTNNFIFPVQCVLRLSMVGHIKEGKEIIMKNIYPIFHTVVWFLRLIWNLWMFA